MTSVIIDDIIPRTQLTATALQTVFNTNWTVDATTDVLVYARAAGVAADDSTQLVSASDYTVTLIGVSETVRVTFAVGRTLNDIITIVRNTPADRMNLYSNTNFIPSMLNEDFGILTLVDQQAQMYDTVVNPGYNVSESITDKVDTVLPLLEANQIWAKNSTNTEIIAYNVPSGGGIAPSDAKYIIKQADSELPNAQSLGSLASGLMVNTTTTGDVLTRTLTGTSNQIDVANGNGIAANPTLSISDNVILPGFGSFKPPQGTTAQRPGAPVDGMVRYNTDLLALEVYEGSVWDPLSGGVVDSVSGTLNQITLNNSDPANPIVLLSDDPIVPGNSGVTLPTGNTAQRAGTLGTVRFNSQTSVFEGTTDGATWYTFLTGAGTVLSVSGTANQIDSTGGVNPVLSLSATANFPGTFDIQSSNAVDGIINDNTMATASNTKLATSSSIKNYVDAVAIGLNIQGSCVCSATAPLTATYDNGTAGVGATLTNSGALAAISLDGVSPTVGQRVLIPFQASSLENGIYTVTTEGSGAIDWVLTRATDFDQPTEIQPGDFVVITSGTLYSGSSWIQTDTVTTVGTDSINFIQFSASIPVSVANGGSSRTSATAYAPIVGGTTSTNPHQSVTLGASGTLFQSAGAAALPTFTTATYPSLATTAGTLLRANGTNWIESTSTFADTYTASNLLYSNGANTVTGLATANNGILVTSAGGVPSISSTLPAGISASGMLLTSPRLITSLLDTNGNNLATVTATGSAVNYMTWANAATAGNPVIGAAGTDANVQLQISGKGTSGVITQGITSGSNPAAGYRGEVISSTVLNASAVALTTATSTNITSISLTAGNWLVIGIGVIQGSLNITQSLAWTSSTSATLPDAALRAGISNAASSFFGYSCEPQVYNFSGTTTVYLECYAVFGSGSATGCGQIIAIRI